MLDFNFDNNNIVATLPEFGFFKRSLLIFFFCTFYGDLPVTPSGQ